MHSLKLIGLVVSIVVILAVIRGQELRFCYHGPHKLDMSSCQGGILFNHPIPVSCLFVAKGVTDKDGRATVSANVCDVTKGEDIDIAEVNPAHTFSVSSLQEVTYDSDSDAPATAGVDLKTRDDCVEQCFGEWLPIDELTVILPGENVTDHDKEPVYTYPKLSSDQKQKQKDISEQLFLKLQLGESVNNDLRVLKLLRASFIVMTTYCPEPYISQSLIQRVIDAFSIFMEFDPTPIKDVGMREFHEILDVLAQCRSKDKYSSFEMIPENCTDLPAIRAARFWHQNGTTMTRKFSSELKRKLDPFVEAAWNAISFVNAQCFPDFGNDDFNLHHVYEVAMESLYTKLILLRWVEPPELKDPAFWNNLLGTSHFEVELSNIQICNKLAHIRNPYRKRLERPFRRENSTDSPREEEEQDKGWTKSSQEYWDTYNAKGGIMKVLRRIGGTCYKSYQEREAAKETQMKQECKEVPAKEVSNALGNSATNSIAV